MTIWVVLAFFTGAALGILVMALASAAAEDSWKIAYLNLRDHVWRLEREQEGA